MGTEPTGDGGAPLGREGMFITLPAPTVPGEVVPPIPCQFQASLTDPDVKGHRWIIFTISDDTLQVSARIPWQLAPQLAAQITQGFQQLVMKAASEQNGGLVLPNGPASRGGLLVPGPGAIPPEFRR